MTRVDLPDIPKEPRQVEDYLCALFHAAGWCVETGVVLRDEGVEILEIDARAVQIDKTCRTVVLSEAKSGGWGAPDIFKLLGWRAYLGADRAVFASTKEEADITEALRRHADAAGVTILHLGNAEQARQGFADANLGRPDELEVTLWRLAALVDRAYRSAISAEVKSRRDDRGPTTLKEHHRLVGERVLFIADPVDQARELYAAYDERPRLTLALAKELDGCTFVDDPPSERNQRLLSAIRAGSDLLLHCSMWVEYRCRLAILRAAVEATIDQPVQGTRSPWTLMTLRSTFAAGMDWLREQPTFWRYPALWEQFCWTWGGFLLTDRLEEEYSALGESSGVPEGEVSVALEAFDRLFPVQGGWFRTPGPTKAKRLSLFPFHFHGIGAFRRRLNGWTPPPDSPADHTGGDVVRWHNATVQLIGT